MSRKTKAERKVTKADMERILPEWCVFHYGDQGCFDVEKWSPEGEDVIITLWGKTFRELAEYARGVYEDFDADEHASKIFLAKRAGNEDERRFYADAPDSLTDLLADANAIKEMYGEVHAALQKAA